MNKKKSVCVIGLGYIGLPTAALVSKSGFLVKGVDINPDIVNTINQGQTHIIEPSLCELVSKQVKKGYLRAYTEPQEADVFMICVPTPFTRHEGILDPNIEFVKQAAKSIAEVIKDGDLVLLESTSPLGTTEVIYDILLKCLGHSNFNIAYCPERVLPGNILHEFIHNDRIVGGINEESAQIASNFYKEFIKGEIIQTTAKTAELCKLVENSFRDVNIAFANELSLICDNNNVDIWELISLANRHPRVNILNPGPGVGGHCIAVDPWFIVSSNPKDAILIKTSRLINENKPHWVINKIKLHIDRFKKRTSRDPNVICFGLSFKPDIDDLRESPSLKIVKDLSASMKNIFAVEPNINNYEGIKMLSIDQGINKGDIFIFLVKHKEFLNPGFISRLKSKEILDFCGVFS